MIDYNYNTIQYITVTVTTQYNISHNRTKYHCFVLQYKTVILHPTCCNTQQIKDL